MVTTIEVLLSPAVSPLDRGTIEDELAEALGPATEFVGGGTLFGDPPESDFTLELPSNDARSVQDVFAVCRPLLAAVPFSERTRLTLTVERGTATKSETFEVGAKIEE